MRPSHLLFLLGFFLLAYTGHAQVGRDTYNKQNGLFSEANPPTTLADSSYLLRKGRHWPDSQPILLEIPVFIHPDFQPELQKYNLYARQHYRVQVGPDGRAIALECDTLYPGIACDPLAMQMAKACMPSMRYYPAMSGSTPITGWTTITFEPNLGLTIGPYPPKLTDPIKQIDDTLKLEHYRKQRTQCLEGHTFLRLHIDEFGNPGPSLVVHEDHPFVTKIILKKLSTMDFQPAYRDAPTPAWYTMSYPYKLGPCP